MIQELEAMEEAAEFGEKEGVKEKGEKGEKGDIIGKNPGSNNLTVSKDGGEVDAITASTITSRAFLRAVNAAYAALSGNADAQTGATQQANTNE